MVMSITAKSNASVFLLMLLKASGQDDCDFGGIFTTVENATEAARDLDDKAYVGACLIEFHLDQPGDGLFYEQPPVAH